MSKNTEIKTTNENLPVIGILGDGQLAMMMIQAYHELGGQAYVFGESADSPASEDADKLFIGSTSNDDELSEFFNAVDIVTLENEFHESSHLIHASSRCATPVFPDPARYKLIEDKLSENLFFQDLDIKIADFFEVKSEQDLIDAPGYLKLAKGGYDGIGTYRVNGKNEAVDIYNKIKSSGVVLFEYTVDFKKELSLIAASNSSDIIFYPLVETHQEEGTCRYVTFPAGISKEVEQQAQDYVKRIMDKLDTRGLFAFEFFLTHDDQLILNESAPRPHNSGHITLDLMDCSQFENHMRAVADLPLIEPKLLKDSMLMVNLLGTRNGPFDPEELTTRINDPDSAPTFYRKQSSRIKRKMGHINLWGSDQKQRAENLINNLEV